MCQLYNFICFHFYVNGEQRHSQLTICPQQTSRQQLSNKYILCNGQLRRRPRRGKQSGGLYHTCKLFGYNIRGSQFGHEKHFLYGHCRRFSYTTCQGGLYTRTLQHTWREENMDVTGSGSRILGGYVTLLLVALITKLTLSTMGRVAGTPVTGTRRRTGVSTCGAILPGTSFRRPSGGRALLGRSTSTLSTTNLSGYDISSLCFTCSRSNGGVNYMVSTASPDNCNNSVGITVNVSCRAGRVANFSILSGDRATNLNTGYARSSFATRFTNGSTAGLRCIGNNNTSNSARVSTVDNTAVAAGTIARTMGDTLTFCGFTLGRKWTLGGGLRELGGNVVARGPAFILVLNVYPALTIAASTMGNVNVKLTAATILVVDGVVVSTLHGIVPSNIHVPTCVIVITSFMAVIRVLLRTCIAPLCGSLKVCVPLVIMGYVVLNETRDCTSGGGVVPSVFSNVNVNLNFAVNLASVNVIHRLVNSNSIFKVHVLPRDCRNISVFILTPNTFLILTFLYTLRGGLNTGNTGHRIGRSTYANSYVGYSLSYGKRARISGGIWGPISYSSFRHTCWRYYTRPIPQRLPISQHFTRHWGHHQRKQYNCVHCRRFGHHRRFTLCKYCPGTQS